MSEKPKVICVGSRKSELALIQTKHVISCLQKLYPGQKFEIHTMTTMGDRVLNISLPKIGEKALFTKDLEDALHSGRVDFVVHSLKDLPTCLPHGMCIGAILEREDPRDALVLRHENVGKSLKSLPKGSIIGTSSLRRGAQLARKYPHLVVQDIRGNLNTRLAKLDADGSKFAGIILAQAGLVRMGWKDRISETLNSDDILYAVGQGALAVECRSNDATILTMLRNLSCLQTQCKILTERSFLKTLGGGCSAPVAVITGLERKHHDNKEDSHYDLSITGAVWSLDGTIEVLSHTKCTLNLACNDDENDEIIPTKRMKLADSPPLSPPQSEAKHRKKPVSPTIVDDSQASCSSAAKDGRYDIKELLDIHGDLFKKCPYAVHHQAANDAHKCPLSMAVGQDVMGECPYFNAGQKSLASMLVAKNETVVTTFDVMDSGFSFAKAETAVKTFDVTDSGCRSVKAVSADQHMGDGDSASQPQADKCPLNMAVGRDVMGKCPYGNADQKSMASMLAAKNETASATFDVTDSACPFVKAVRTDPHKGDASSQVLPAAKCPFISAAKTQQHKNEVGKQLDRFVMIDVDHTRDYVVKPAHPVADDDVILFCGLFRHKCYSLDVFEKCEETGRRLAKNLIANGALKVMEKAQSEIRKKI